MTLPNCRTQHINLPTLLSEFENGASVKELAEKYKVHPATIRNKLTLLGVKSMKRKKVDLPSKEVLEEELRNEGGMKALHVKYGMTYSTFRNRVLALGIVPTRGDLRSPVAPHYKKGLNKTEPIKSLYEEEGLSCREIAKKVGMSHQGVLNRLRAEGVEIIKSRKKPPQEDVEALISKGADLEDLCGAFKVSSSTMRKYLKEWEIKLPRKNRPTTLNYPMDKLIASYQEGKTLKELADIYGGCVMSIHRYLKKAGVRD